MSNLNIFFKEDHFIAMQRSELYGWVDFIANCGGLVGLFMGFSLLSIIESVYSILLFKSNKNELTTDLDNKPDKINNNTNLRIISVSSIPEEFKKISKNEYLP